MSNIDRHIHNESASNILEVMSVSETNTMDTATAQTSVNEGYRFGNDLEKATKVRRETAEILNKTADILMQSEIAGEDSSGKLGFEQDIVYLNNVSENLRQGVFRLLVLGDMKRGKSTLLNAIIGEKSCLQVLTLAQQC